MIITPAIYVGIIILCTLIGTSTGYMLGNLLWKFIILPLIKKYEKRNKYED